MKGFTKSVHTGEFDLSIGMWPIGTVLFHYAKGR